ncbi:MAG: two-component sensor histidine kinase [Actinobacteria bacterium]|nr:two-component sensor histidine kinase [Actinomycetota bacterium]
MLLTRRNEHNMNDFTWLLTGAGLAGGLVVLALGVVSARRRRSTSPGQSSRAANRDDALAPSGREWAIIERMAEGLVVLSDLLRPVAANRAGRELLGFPEGSLPPRLPSDEVRTVARRALDRSGAVEEVVSIWFPARKTLRVRAEPLDSRGGVVVVIEDVTEELETQRIRREFVAHASHELKSPVASMQTLAEALRHAVREDPSAAQRFADRIEFESARLGRLIGDLLDLSRLEDPDAVPREVVDLSAGAKRVMEDAEHEAVSKEITLDVEISDGVFVKGDEAQMAVLVRNLVENAVRYTPEGGRVSVDVYQEDESAVVRVSDNGIGIPMEAQGRVFERFYRVDRARSRDRGGTGLGLAIVKHVAELHGGIVELESELGRGSIFTARVPAVRPPPQRIASAG